MAAPSYTTDLTIITNASTGLIEGVGDQVGAISSGETENFIQGIDCTSKSTGNAIGLCSAGFLSTVTIPTDGIFNVWIYFASPQALATQTSGGMQLIVGQDASNYKRYYVRGSDTYQYGGWLNVPVSPTVTPSASYGTPTAVTGFFGYSANLVTKVSKGNPYAIDAMYYGRGTIEMTLGDLANGYATFAGASLQNDNISNRWGLFQDLAGSYLMQGRLSFGTAATAVDFRDTNAVITIANAPYVTASYNTFEVLNASSRVDWTGVSVISLNTVSRGRFLVTDNATINLITCSFSDMNTFTFQSNSTLNGVTFRRCGQVTQGGATITGCTFDGSIAPISLLVGDISLVTNTDFISSGTGYAMEGFSTAGDYTLTGLNFTNYAALDATTVQVVMAFNWKEIR